jgi:AraC-like DNA-binding protein
VHKKYTFLLHYTIAATIIKIYKTIIMQISPDALRLGFLQAGAMEIGKDGPDERRDGWVHHKTVPYTIIAQATTGHYDITAGDNLEVRLQPGEAILTAPDIPLVIAHHCDRISGKMRMRWVHFNFLIFDSINLAQTAPFPLKVPVPWANRFGETADRLYKLQNKGDTADLATAARTKRLGYNLLVLFLDFLRSEGITPDINPGLLRLFPVLARINQDPGQKLTVEDLAAQASLSVPHFHAEFKKAVGIPPLNFVRRQRLAKACDLLRAGSAGLEEIAQVTGFNSAYHLSREFKKRYGIPPGQFRKRFSQELIV